MPTDTLPLFLSPVLILAGLAASALATAAETALLTLQRQQEDGYSPGGAETELTTALLAEQDRLVFSLRAFNFAAKACVALAAATLMRLLCAPYPFAGVVFGGALALLAVLIVAEIVPKSIPEASAFAVSVVLAPFVWIIVNLLRPLVWAPLAVSRRLSKASDGLPGPEAEIREIELRTLLSLGEIEGVIEEDTRDIIEGIFTFGDSVAGEIMTPRVELTGLNEEELSDAAAVRDHLRQSPFSRMLVYRDSIDHIIGVLDRKHVLLHPDAPLTEQVRHPIYAPESRKLIDLLADMKQSRIRLAVILDEYGGTAGVVTMEDLLNEIVGQLEDDASRGAEIRETGERTWLVSGRLEIETLNDRLETHIPVDTAYTVSGCIMATLGRLPRVGDEVRINGARLVVTRMGARRVAQARLELTEPVSETNGRSENGARPAANGALSAGGATARSEEDDR